MIRKSSAGGNAGRRLSFHTAPALYYYMAMRRLSIPLLLTFIALIAVPTLLFSVPLSGREELVLTFAGDLIPHGPLHQIDRRAFAGLSEQLLGDDLTFVNLETPLHPDRAPSGFPDFNAPLSFLQAAIDGGVEVFSLANNHSLDQGTDGVAWTETVLARHARRHGGVYFSGLEGWSDGPPPARLIEKKGYRIGFLSVTQFLNHWPPGEPQRRLNLLDGRNREHFMEDLRPEAYDFFILAYHGDALEEYESYPLERKQRFLTSLARAGVDLIWGHHPHVPQPPASIDRGEERSLVLPSTGNFLTGQGLLLHPEQPDPESRHAATNDGYLYRVTLAPARESRSLEITGLELIPLTNASSSLPGGRKVTTFRRAVEEAPSAAWREYYRERERILQEQAAAWLGATHWGAPGTAGRETP